MVIIKSFAYLFLVGQDGQVSLVMCLAWCCETPQDLGHVAVSYQQN